jgi:hypothetical protein
MAELEAKSTESLRDLEALMGFVGVGCSHPQSVNDLAAPEIRKGLLPRMDIWISSGGEARQRPFYPSNFADAHRR